MKRVEDMTHGSQTTCLRCQEPTVMLPDRYVCQRCYAAAPVSARWIDDAARCEAALERLRMHRSTPISLADWRARRQDDDRDKVWRD